MKQVLTCFFSLIILPLFAEPSVLELVAKPDRVAPDILFLAPKTTAAPKLYAKSLEQAVRVGTVLPNAALTVEDFCASGPLPVLAAAGYRILPVRDVPWREACARLTDILALRRKTRVEDGIVQEPLCALLSEEAAPEELMQTLGPLLDTDALIFLAPQTNALPVTIAWRNRVWPAHASALPVRVEHWVPTLAEIVGLPAPADYAEASVLPLLTGVGYQRPLDLPAVAPLPMEATEFPCTELRHYAELPKVCPWVPDYTALIPSDRTFVRAFPPLPRTALRGLSASRRPQGLYLRATMKTFSLTLPPRVSCVIREKGRPVFSVWEPESATTWSLDRPEAVPVELFLVVPPGIDPSAFTLFHAPEPTP